MLYCLCVTCLVLVCGCAGCLKPVCCFEFVGFCVWCLVSLACFLGVDVLFGVWLFGYYFVSCGFCCF